MDAVSKDKHTAARSRHNEHLEADFALPPVDMAYAASLRPTRVKGKHAMWLVILVSGAGVSVM